jgi:putative ABC transport system permease protein
MLKNYLLLSLRNLKSNKGFSMLNIIGLSLGITCALLIGLWVKDELQYDRFHAKYKNLYRLFCHQTYDGKTFTFGAMPGPLADAMQQEIPGIKEAVRTDWGQNWGFSYKDKLITELGIMAEPEFLDIFSFPLVKGNRNTVLKDIHSIVVTEEMAKKFFGDEDPIGKSLRANGSQDYIVTGVIKDPPKNSTVQFHWLAPYEGFRSENDWLKSWGNNGIINYVELEPGADVNKINAKLKNFIYEKDPEAVAKPFLLSMADLRLRSKFEDGKQVGGRIEYVRLFSIIAIVIIILACINFMNLATARSEQRSKEIGVRKVIGATRKMLVGQFLTESILMALMATVLATLLTYFVLPYFDKLVEKELVLDVKDSILIAGLFIIALVSGLLAGSYPSLYLSSFKPVHAFKRMRAGRNATPVVVRKVLVVSQFVVSIVLIIGTIVIYLQVKHVRSRPLGYDKDNLIYTVMKGEASLHLDAIHNDLLNTGVVEGTSVASSMVLELGSNTGGISWAGKPAGQDILITVQRVDPNYISTIGMTLKEGRDFYPAAGTDSASVIINEAFAKLINKATPVGELLHWGDENVKIVGVVKDFVYQDMYAPPAPMLMLCNPREVPYLYVRLKKGVDTQAALAKVGQVMSRYAPGTPVEFKFLTDWYDRLFRTEMLISDLSKLFAGLAIFISCLGLFGLSAYTAERRTKEIGIRKVLGASVGNIVLMLSMDFLKLVFIAAVIAFPLAWWVMSNWLKDYAYRIDLEWWVFGAAGICAFAIAVFTICFQGIKTARLNPVMNLRTE